jgi:cytochrome c
MTQQVNFVNHALEMRESRAMKIAFGNCRFLRFSGAAILGGFWFMVGVAFADGDVVKGEQVFKKCMACHTVTDKTNKVGPYLVGVVGRKVASVEGFNYSASMKEYAATGAVWDEATLQAYLENPKMIVSKTKMAFAGLKKPDERNDLIAYLKSKM